MASPINEVAKLHLHPKNDPRDARIYDRISSELEPVAKSIMEEYRAGYTDEEIQEQARKDAEKFARREEAKDAALESLTEQAGQTVGQKHERLREIEGAILKYAEAGPVRVKMLWPALRRAGFSDQDFLEVKRSDRLRFFRVGDNGPRMVEARQEEPQPA